MARSGHRFVQGPVRKDDKSVDPMPEVRHYELSRSQLVFSAASIAAAVMLEIALAVRIATHVQLTRWWVLPVLLMGVATADLASGLVHWAADTWGHDELPVVGHRLLVPFRVHHINPDDFLRRRFIDTNGDVAFVAVPFILAMLAAPLDTRWSPPVVVFGFAFCAIGMLTNQIHQWAHMPSPPSPVRVLQDYGIILNRTDHEVHHHRPHNVHYSDAGYRYIAADVARAVEEALPRTSEHR